jgi:imidazole glycerol-phosphate synthase subunit HisF
LVSDVLRHRVIPCLLIHEGGLVKTQKFTDPRYVGDPINAIRIFNEKEVDELLVLDIDASKERRGPKFEVIKELAGECFMPLAYGGGITSADQVQRLFALGVEKVSVQTAALSDLKLVTEIARRYGSQAVVISIDVKKNLIGQHKLYAAVAGKAASQDWLDFLHRAVDAGAGEVLLNSVDRDGTMSGMDLPLIQRAAAACSVPLIASGGVGSVADIKAAVVAGASAVAAGAFFVYYGKHRAVLITYPRYEELVELLDR